MATKTNQSVITSFKDGAYRQARANDSLEDTARFVLGRVPSFPDTIPDEVKEGLYEGYRMRYNENNPAKTYAIINDRFVLIDGSNPELEKEKDKRVIGVDYVFSFTQQQYGKLKDTDPYLYPIVKDIREGCNSYCSNRLGDLKRTARRLLNKGKISQRSATLDFDERVNKTLDDLKDKCKTANAREDATANSKKLALAITAFMKVWNS